MFDLTQNISIETKRLIIKNPSMDDFPEVFKMKCCREVTKFTGGVTKESYEKEMSNYFKRINTFGTKNNYVFSLIEKKSNKYVGYCGFRFCNIINNIEIIYGFSKSAWQKGYGKEAALKILFYGFNDLKYEEIYAVVNPLNTASERILTHIGMKYIKKIDLPDHGKVSLYFVKREEFLNTDY